MDFIGNKKVTDNLSRIISKGLLGHAYIFSGPQGVGKMTLAKKFAQAAIAGCEMDLDLNKEDKDSLLDLVLLAPELVEKKDVIKQKDISIEKVREVQQTLGLFPYHGKYKILIIEDAHRLNNSAQNALLKLLEEPNGTSIIILVTHEIDRILPTVLSRCEKINFSLATDDELKSMFEKKEKFDYKIIALSMGRPGLAKLMIENQEEFDYRKKQGDQLSILRTGSLNEKMLLAEEYAKDTRKTLEIFNMWLWLLREEMIRAEDDRGRDWNYFAMEKIQKTMTLMKSSNANSRLLLESLFVDL